MAYGGWTVRLTGSLAALVVLASLGVATAPASAADPECGEPVAVGTRFRITCSFTGGPQQWTVPAGVTRAQFDVQGAQGGGSQGGRGGRAVALREVAPGAVYQVNVGATGDGGGFNGGAQGGENCSTLPGGPGGSTSFCMRAPGGGGASDVRVAPFGLSERVIVGGGGGGWRWLVGGFGRRWRRPTRRRWRLHFPPRFWTCRHARRSRWESGRIVWKWRRGERQQRRRGVGASFWRCGGRGRLLRRSGGQSRERQPPVGEPRRRRWRRIRVHARRLGARGRVPWRPRRRHHHVPADRNDHGTHGNAQSVRRGRACHLAGERLGRRC